MNNIPLKPVLDQDRQKKAREYSRTRRYLGFSEAGLSLVLLLVLIFSGVSVWFTRFFQFSPVAVAVVYFLIMTVLYYLIVSPLSYYRGFVLPHRYGLSIQSLGPWLVDQAKGGAMGLLFGSASVAVIYWLLSTFPNYWWLMAWGLMVIVSVLMTIVAPVLLVPLFFKVKPLADGELKTRLEQLSQKARTKIQGVYTLDFSRKGTTANAALMGMGITRRIVISDTLIQQYTTSEIEVVTAHEIGHHVDRDIYRILVIQIAVSLISLRIVDAILKSTAVPLGFDAIADPAAFPLLLLIFGVISALFSPVLRNYSRIIESQADGFALLLTHDPESFMNAMTRLINQNLGVAYPARWEEFLLYDHPSYNKRVELAKKYLRFKGQNPTP
jgi:STE24 endopeptidase